MEHIITRRRGFRKLLAFLLCMASILGLLPAQAFAMSVGQTASSWLGDQYVGSDGNHYRAPAPYTYLAYHADGTIDVHTSSGGNAYRHYMLTDSDGISHQVYCVESGIPYHTSENTYVSESGTNSQYLNLLPAEARRGITLTAIYGWKPGATLPVSGINEDDYKMATQIILWEYQQQLRSDPYNRHGNGHADGDQYFSVIAGRPAEKAYDWILAQVASHSTVPSFTSSKKSEAPELELKWDVEKKVYTLTVTDTNNLKIDLEALKGSGVSVTRNGNEYTFTSRQMMMDPVLFEFRKNIPVANDMLIWGRPGYQTMMTGASDPVSFFVKIKTETYGTAKLVKTSEDGIVSGITFHISGTDILGNEVNEEVTTGENGQIEKKLLPGTYLVKEVSTSAGYVLDSTPVYFDVTEDNSSEERGVTVIEVTKPNMAQKGIIKVSKTGEVFSSVTENEGVYQPVYEVQGLPGAVFEITALEDVYTLDGTLRYSAGEVVDTITTGEDGTAQSQPLYLGKFQVKEIQFPHGMVDTGENVTNVELVYAGQEVEVTETSASFYNQRQKALVTLDKVLEQDETFGIGMNGEISAVTFGLYAQEDITAADGSVIPADGLLEIVSVNENGQAVCSTDLPFGSFYLKELSTDSHYLLNGETFPFTFEYGGPSVAVVEISANDGEAVTNELIRGEIKGLKTDENGTGLGGAVIGLFKSDETEFTAENALATTTSADDGSFSFTNVPYGDWVLKELESPEGFILSDEVIPVTVEEDGQVVEISLANERVYGDLRLTKVDKDYPDNKLTGAEFEVYRDTNGNKELDEGDELLGKLEETSTGIYEMSHILYGGVFVRETKAPEGFLLDENAYYVEITENGKIY